MIRDIEVSLLSITDPAAREYMTEAVRCYHAGAYRAAVVVAVAAAVSDLREKLTKLASSGGAPGQLVTSMKLVTGLHAAQKPLEQEVIRAAEEDAGMISPADGKELRALLVIRHLCAHPSGHSGTAEEARNVITRMIDIALARPAVLGVVGVEEILSRLPSPVFFPRTGHAELAATVAREVANLHGTLLPALVDRIVTVVEAEMAAAAAVASKVVTPLRQNAVHFLTGMVAGGELARSATWKSRRIGDLVQAAAGALDALVVLDGDPSGLRLVDPLTRSRLLALIRQNLGEALVRVVARKLLEGAVLDPGEEEDLLNATKAKFITNWSLETPCLVAELGWSKLEAAFAEALVVRVGQGTFTIANAAIDTMQALPAPRANAFGDVMLARYLLNVASAAHGPYPAYKAAALTKTGLGARSSAIDAFARELARDPASVQRDSTDWAAVGKILVASGRPTIAAQLLTAFQGLGRAIPIELASEMVDSADATLAQLGARLAAEWKVAL
jgi:hypothetical protein